MAFTFQQLIDRARVPLNDSDADRYTDAELLTYGIDAYLILRRFRPDILLGAFASPTSFSTLTLVSDFPYVGDEYLPVIADYVTARAEFKDDENIVKERAVGFYNLFSKGASI